MIKIYIFLCLFLSFSLSLAGEPLPTISLTFSKNDLKSFLNWNEINKENYTVNFKMQNSENLKVKVKYKGHTSRLFPKKGLFLKFSSSDQLPRQFEGYSDINLNPMYTDKSFIREKLAWKIFRDMKGFGPRDLGYFRVFVNNVDLGVFLAIPAINDKFLKLNGYKGDDLFEGEDNFNKADFTPLGEEHLMETYEKKSGGEKGYSKLKRLIESLNSATDENFSQFFETNFNSKTVYDWFLLNILSMQGDSYIKNYFLYFEKAESKNWSIIPWDYDISFGRDGSPLEPYPLQILNDLFSYSYPALSGPDNKLKEKFMRSESQIHQLRSQLDNAFRTFASPEAIEKDIDMFFKELKTDIKNDKYKWGTNEDFENQIDALKYYAIVRNNFLQTTFLNSNKNKFFNEAVVSEIKPGFQYSFVDGQGKSLALIKFNTVQGLNSLKIKAHPLQSPPGIGKAEHIKRYLEIIPEPANAKFEAEIIWEYLDGVNLTEVSSGATEDNAMSAYIYTDGKFNKISSKLNSYANYVKHRISEKICGANKFLIIRREDGAIYPWAKIKLPLWQRIYDVAVDKDHTIFAVGDDGLLLKSKDNGRSWSQHFVGSHTRLTSIAINAENSLFVSDQFGQILNSNDHGLTWNNILEFQNLELKDIVFINEKEGLAVGTNGLILSSNNGGGVWSRINTNLESIDLYNIAKFSENELYLGTAKGLFKSTDHGKSWNLIKQYEKNKVNALYIDSGGILWVAGDTGKLFKFELKSNSGTFVASGTKEDIRTVYVNNSRVYIAGMNAYLADKKINDKNFVQHEKRNMADLLGFFTNNEHDLFIFGSSGTLLKSILNRQ